MARELGEPRGAWRRGCPFLWSLSLLSPSPIHPGALGAFRVVIFLGLRLCGGRVVPSPFWPQLQHHPMMVAMNVAWISQAKASPTHP